MSDWDDVAADYAAAQQSLNQARQQRRQQEEAQRRAEQIAADQRRQALDAAEAEGARALAAYLRDHEASARRLIAAAPNNVIPFGHDTGGGYFSGVYFGEDGLTKERGQAGSIYGSQPPPPPQTEPCSVEEAVRYYSLYGMGNSDPEQVRQVARWFEQKLAGVAEHMRKTANQMKRELDELGSSDRPHRY